MFFEPAFAPYDPTDTSGFSYETVHKRWPVILAGIVDQLARENHEIHGQIRSEADHAMKERLEEKLQEGKSIIGIFSKLKYRMARDHVMEPIAPDGEAHVEAFNVELAQLAESKQNTWFTAPWLYAECYLYRLARSYTVQTTHWKDFDPFLAQKIDVFRSSSKSIFQLAEVMSNLDSEKDAVDADPNKLYFLFENMLHMCLWGNATDLSLLTHHSLSDLEALQSVGKDMARQAFILRNDQELVWKHIEKLSDQRVDFVLDNAGFELFTDLVFADFLVTHTPFFSKAVFHPKMIPWFVSDVTPPDFSQSIDLLLDPSFFPTSPTATQAEDLKRLASRWKSYVEEGIFSLSVPLDTPLGGGKTPATYMGQFWTTPWPYWDMKIRDAELWGSLRESELVIFKGDLNFRKLTGDIQWPAWTPFEAALGPLAGSFPLLSLRTNKADVVVGVDKDTAKKLDQSGEKWRVNGRYALVSFLDRNK